MTNEQYKNELTNSTEAITVLRKEACYIAAGIIGKTLLTEDLYFCSTLDRSIHLKLRPLN